MALLEVLNLRVHYSSHKRLWYSRNDSMKAVDDVSFSVHSGEIYGLVGESGSGKSTIAKAIMGLVSPTGGTISFRGKNLLEQYKGGRSIRREIQMIFQDPFSSLNPKKTIQEILLEPIRNFNTLSKTEEIQEVSYFLKKVGLSPEDMKKYPYQFSGGQRQRIGIARSLTLKPSLIIGDEPVSSLDVSVQAQVLNFIKELQKEFKLTYLLIGHDLGVIRHMCDRVGVMLRGRIVEEGKVQELFQNPLHPYTKLLLSSMPGISPKEREVAKKIREDTKLQYEKDALQVFNPSGRPFDLKQVSPTHKVAFPREEF